MRLAADRDLVARQYTNQFADVLSAPPLGLKKACVAAGRSTTAIVHAHFGQLRRSRTVSSPQMRPQTAEQARDRAAGVLASWLAGDAAYRRGRSTASMSGCGPTAIAAIRAQRPI